jgi:hypothetical protein
MASRFAVRYSRSAPAWFAAGGLQALGEISRLQRDLFGAGAVPVSVAQDMIRARMLAHCRVAISASAALRPGR